MSSKFAMALVLAALASGCGGRAIGELPLEGEPADAALLDADATVAHCPSPTHDPFAVLTLQVASFGSPSPLLTIRASCEAVLEDATHRKTIVLEPPDCARLAELVACDEVLTAAATCGSYDYNEWMSVTFASGRKVRGDLSCAPHEGNVLLAELEHRLQTTMTRLAK